MYLLLLTSGKHEEMADNREEETSTSLHIWMLFTLYVVSHRKIAYHKACCQRDRVHSRQSEAHLYYLGKKNPSDAYSVSQSLMNYIKLNFCTASWP
jgi:hypothetical protein